MIEISCRALQRELSNYIEDDLAPELRERIERHVERCSHCRALLDGLTNVLHLLGTGEFMELPTGFSQRLQTRIASACKLS